MTHPDPEDRQLMAVVRRLLGESTDDTDRSLDRFTDAMLEAGSAPTAARPRALRFARAVIHAAAIQVRLEQLTETLADAEWARGHAEAVVDKIVTRLHLGDQQVVATGLEDEISDDINALVSLGDGRVWVRDKTVYMDRERSKYWLHAETSERGVSVYEWPLDGGPFIALPDHWYLRHLVDTARRRDTDEQRIRDLTRSRDGYEYPYTGGLAKMLEAVLHAADRQRVDLNTALDHERQKLHDIRRAHSSPITPREQHEAVLEILDRPAPETTSTSR